MTATMTNGHRTQAELAAEHGVSERTIRRWQKKDKAVTSKVSGNGHAPTTARVRQPAKAKPWLSRRRVMIAITSLGAVMVAVVTFWVSYQHIRHLAELHGHAEVAGWLPLGVDGLVIACAASLVMKSRLKENPVAWVGVVVGLVGTVTANVLAVPQDPIAQVMAGFMPIALAVSVHIVLRMIGR